MPPLDKYEKESEERIAEDDSKDYPKIKTIEFFTLRSSLFTYITIQRPWHWKANDPWHAAPALQYPCLLLRHHWLKKHSGKST